MAVSIGQTGTADPVDVEYSTWEADEAAIRIHMHLDAVDGIARDVVEGFRGLPRPGVEVGGLLLGHVEPGIRRVVWIDRYQRIECGHRFGPQFALTEEEHAALDQAAGAISQTSELAVVGFYRSHTRPGFQLEDPDFQIVARYFSDSSDILLLIKPENMIDISAQFFTRKASGAVAAAGKIFPFRGRVVGPPDGITNGTDQETPAEPSPLGNRESTNSALFWDARVPGVPVAERQSEQPRESAALPEKIRRLVPDFVPAEDQPRITRELLTEPAANLRTPPMPSLHFLAELEESPIRAFGRKWWPLLGAVVLVGGAAWFLLQIQPGQHDTSAPAAAEASPSIRPLGLYVDGSGQTWRVSWNPSASALRGARGVELFVRDGDDQNRIDLSSQDLASGKYQYQPKGQDVTFRLEVTGSGGQLSAESFRLMKTAPPLPVKPPPAATPPPATPEASRNTTAPRAIHKVPPVVPASIRPRIKGSIPIDVRVHVDSKGRVTSATPVTKPHSGLQEYLAGRAVYAARLWRFEPARQNGKAVPGVETIHFVFEK